MSVFDLIALAILAFNTLRGLARGLVRTSFGLAAVSVASFLAWDHPEWGRPIASAVVKPGSPWWNLVAPFAVWVITFVALNAIGAALRMALDQTPLRALDRLGGAAFGLATGIVIVAIPLLLVARLPLLRQVKPLQTALHRSLVATALAPVVRVLTPLGSGELKALAPALARVQQANRLTAQAGGLRSLAGPAGKPAATTGP